MVKQSINLAFVGSGNWARKYHFPALAHLRTTLPSDFDIELHLHGIYSLEPVIAGTVAEQYGFGQVYPNFHALIDDEDIDAVAVAVAPTALTNVIEHLIVRQVPLFSEKPPGISAAEAHRLANLVTVPNVLAFNRRFAPLNNRFREIVRAMDQIYFVDAHFLRYARLEKGFFVETAIHWINYLEYVFGEIQQVSVEMVHNPDHPSASNRIASLTFLNGLPGRLTVFPCSGSQVERVAVHSSAKSVYLDGPLWESAGQIVIDTGASQETTVAERQEALPEIIRLGIVGEYKEFLTRACGGQPTRSTFQNGVNTMRVAEAIEQGRSL